jgi:hypothetical protein
LDVLVVFFFEDICYALAEEDAAGADAEEDEVGIVGEIVVEVGGEEGEGAVEIGLGHEGAEYGEVFGHGGVESFVVG